MRNCARPRARPWPARPVSEANMSGRDTAATRRALTGSCSLQARNDVEVVG